MSRRAKLSEQEEERKLMILLGRRFKELRKKAGYTSYETFSYDADIPRGDYGRYENGKRNPYLYSIYRIIKFHNMSLKEFFSEGFDDLDEAEFEVPELEETEEFGQEESEVIEQRESEKLEHEEPEPEDDFRALHKQIMEFKPKGLPNPELIIMRPYWLD